MTSPLPEFDVTRIPFSRRGAWMNLSPVIAPHTTADHIHVVSHRTGMHPVVRLRPHRHDGSAGEGFTVSATPASLVWAAGDARIEAIFERADAIRVRGDARTAFDLEDASAGLTPFTGAYLFASPGSRSAVFTSYETGCRYRVTVLRGDMSVVGSQALGDAERRVRLSGDEGWEAVVEEFETALEPYVLEREFDDAVESVTAEFERYVDTIAGWRDAGTPAADLACYVLWSATVSPAGFLSRESVLMSKHWMDKIWSWDHCFTALALAPDIPDAAWDQFVAPFDHQDPSGALPDSVAHSERLYNFVKPPIHGWALRRLRDGGLDLTEAQVRRAYELLSRWSEFWLHHRTLPESVLPVYQHGNDSGWDNATTFDRDRVVHAPDLAAFLIVQLDVVAGLARELRVDAERWEREGERLRAALRAELWRGDGFVARGAAGGLSGGADSTRTSLLGLLPLVAGDLLGSDVASALVADVPSFLTEWGLATERVDSPEYEADGYWRGPIWAPSTLLIEDGLRRVGETALADEVSARFRRLCEASGFAENFDALSGEGLRDRAYTWTAAVYLVLAKEAVHAYVQ